jgi:hypothetical protein
MPKPRNPDLQASKAAFDQLKPLLRYRYGDYVLDLFPEIDLNRLHQAKAGRVVYPEGLKALQMVAKLYPRRDAKSLTTNLESIAA